MRCFFFFQKKSSGGGGEAGESHEVAAVYYRRTDLFFGGVPRARRPRPARPVGYYGIGIRIGIQFFLVSNVWGTRGNAEDNWGRTIVGDSIGAPWLMAPGGLLLTL